MAKIILIMDGKVMRDMLLSKERFAIGRGPQNDLVIDSIAVSGEHAVISTTGGEVVLEDLNSTNGTQVNGQPVKIHFLQNGDLIKLAQYQIKYVVDSASSHSLKMPVIQVLNGPNAGKEIRITKAITTLGLAGVQVAVISQSPQGCAISHVEGDAYPIVNGKSAGPKAYFLSDADVIELAGTQMKFVYQ